MRFIITEEEKNRIKRLYEQTSSSPNRFVITKQGVTDYVVVNVPNKDAKTIYDKTLNWASESFRTPTEVIKAKIPNEKVILEGSYQWRGQPIYLTYRMIISIKDNKYKLEIPEMIFRGGATGTFDFKQKTSEYFKDDGSPRSQRTASIVQELEKLLNDINSGLEKYINSDNTVNNDW